MLISAERPNLIVIQHKIYLKVVWTQIHLQQGRVYTLGRGDLLQLFKGVKFSVCKTTLKHLMPGDCPDFQGCRVLCVDKVSRAAGRGKEREEGVPG